MYVYLFTSDTVVPRAFFFKVPPPEPPRSASSTSNETITTSTSPPANALVHLMSQFRMDKPSEPMPMSLSILEKMSLRDTQNLITENGLDK